MKKQIYFAHGRPDYGSDREKDALAFIHQLYPDHSIINPSDKKIQRRAEKELSPFLPVLEYMKFFFEYIDQSEFLIFTVQKNGNIGRGTFEEIKYAFDCNKGVIYVKLPDYVELLQRRDIVEIHTREAKRDWRSHWAKVKNENE